MAIITLKFFTLILLFVTFFTGFYIIVFQSDNNILKTDSPPNNLEDQKVILIWSTYWGKMKYWDRIFARLLKGECAENRCKISTNKHDVETADAILFNANDLKNSIPSSLKHRKPHQVFVFMSFEPPPVSAQSKVDLHLYENFFNWTMTYRRDSDVYVPYGAIHEKVADQKSISDILLVYEVRPQKKIIWISSHCKTFSKRETLVKELQRYIEIDIFGTCGYKKCGKRAIMSNLIKSAYEDDDPCNLIIKNYTFFLSFENSICKDYVTEKFYKSLKHGAIPVVFGGANYSAYAPKNSFIDSSSFSSVKDLADFLHQVSNDEELRRSYHEWRKYYSIEIGAPYKPFICDICKKLHDMPSINKVPYYYENIWNWYVEQSYCNNPN